MSGRWVDLREAAEILETSTEAVRKRAARGSLESSRENGRVLVWVDDGRTEGGREDQDALLEAKAETIRTLREQLEQANERDRENRRIIAALTSRIPAIEAPAAPEAAEPRSDSTTPTEAAAETQETTEPRSWWQRWFGS